jgi:hypothetical protein
VLRRGLADDLVVPSQVTRIDAGGEPRSSRVLTRTGCVSLTTGSCTASRTVPAKSWLRGASIVGRCTGADGARKRSSSDRSPRVPSAGFGSGRVCVGVRPRPTSATRPRCASPTTCSCTRRLADHAPPRRHAGVRPPRRQAAARGAAAHARAHVRGAVRRSDEDARWNVLLAEEPPLADTS